MELHDAAEGIASRSGKGSGVEIHALDKVHVDHSHGSTAGALRREVVDVGNFDAVEVKTVFVGRTATNDNVVPETGDGRHARQRPQGPTDVAPPSWVALDFVGADASNAQRRFLHRGA